MSKGIILYFGESVRGKDELINHFQKDGFKIINIKQIDKSLTISNEVKIVICDCYGEVL